MLREDHPDEAYSDEFLDTVVSFAKSNGLQAAPHARFGARVTVQDNTGRFFFDVEPINRFAVPPENYQGYKERVGKALSKQYAAALHTRRIALSRAQELFARPSNRAVA